MKLLKQFSDEEGAIKYSERLRERGIFTQISSLKSHQLSSAKTGAFKVGVWVVLAEQYQDAVKVLQSTTYEPTLFLNEHEIRELEAHGKDKAFKAWNKFLVVGGLVSALVLVYIFMNIN